ncbi:hypothetical protein, partial [Chromobacterium haemolyticum]|uniref:hypothetical protein n=1 Tax=Chromobacterium haemolyticum TaxID=394935 RepID=UPI001EE68CDE
RAAFGVKGNLAEQIPLSVRRAEPALSHHPRSGFNPKNRKLFRINSLWQRKTGKTRWSCPFSRRRA